LYYNRKKSDRKAKIEGLLRLPWNPFSRPLISVGFVLSKMLCGASFIPNGKSEAGGKLAGPDKNLKNRPFFVNL
jgi:hypothetical protein